MNTINIELLLPFLIPCLIAVCYAMMRSPKVWLGISILCLPLFLQLSGEGLSVTELVFGVFYTIPVVIWIVWTWATTNTNLIRWWGDFFIFLFLALSILNLLVAVLNDVDPISWLSEWSLFFLLLYYFPLREVFGRSERDFKQMLTVSAVSGLLMALSSLYMYKQKMSMGFAFAYQVWSSRSVLLGPVFLLVIFIALVMLFHSNFRGKLLLTGLIVVNSLALFLTFTRTLWISFFLCLPIIMMQLRPRQNLKLMVTMVGMAGLASAGMYVYNPRLTTIVSRVVQNRFLSSTQLSGGDGSFETRLVEAKSAITLIKRYPLGGSGLRKQFLSWTFTDNYHGYHSFVHIGYVGLVYKLGFPTAIIFFICIGLFFVRAFVTYWKTRNFSNRSVTKAVSIGIAAFMPSLLIILFMAGFFDERYGEIMFAFVFACTSITYELAMRAPTELQTIQ
ncbi:MAG: O-antigen ligase family protein [Ignavibacteria bacterium]|nr:O-antigen ligase family protein [Ignavibacteria bacterium]